MRIPTSAITVALAAAAAAPVAAAAAAVGADGADDRATASRRELRSTAATGKLALHWDHPNAVVQDYEVYKKGEEDPAAKKKVTVALPVDEQPAAGTGADATGKKRVDPAKYCTIKKQCWFYTLKLEAIEGDIQESESMKFLDEACNRGDDEGLCEKAQTKVENDMNLHILLTEQAEIREQEMDFCGQAEALEATVGKAALPVCGTDADAAEGEEEEEDTSEAAVDSAGADAADTGEGGGAAAASEGGTSAADETRTDEISEVEAKMIELKAKLAQVEELQQELARGSEGGNRKRQLRAVR